MTFQIWTSPCDGPVTASSTVKKGQIQEGIPQRKKEVVGLNAQIRDLEIRHQEWQLSEERDRHRLRMDRLHAQIVAIQQKMALLWSQHTGKVMPATRDTEAATLDIANKIAPIYCLPPEVLSEIFMAAVMENDHLALDLIRVCRYWRLVLLALPRIWSKIRVGAITSSEKIEYLVEITGRTALDVEIDTESDAIVWTSGLCPYYPALIVLAGTSVRWGSLTIRSFPKEEKLLELEALWAPITFNAPLANLKSFRMTRPCEMNTALGNLIDHTRKAEKSKLTILELSSASALYRFAEASFTVFHFLRVFKVDLTEMNDPLDLLPHFHLEDLYVHRLHLTYPHPQTPISQNKSVQWMYNRTFPHLVDSLSFGLTFQRLSSAKVVSIFRRALVSPTMTTCFSLSEPSSPQWISWLSGTRHGTAHVVATDSALYGDQTFQSNAFSDRGSCTSTHSATTSISLPY
jgi:hypothetical protein